MPSYARQFSILIACATALHMGDDLVAQSSGVQRMRIAPGTYAIGGSGNTPIRSFCIDRFRDVPQKGARLDAAIGSGTVRRISSTGDMETLPLHRAVGRWIHISGNGSPSEVIATPVTGDPTVTYVLDVAASPGVVVGESAADVSSGLEDLQQVADEYAQLDASVRHYEQIIASIPMAGRSTRAAYDGIRQLLEWSMREPDTDMRVLLEEYQEAAESWVKTLSDVAESPDLASVQSLPSLGVRSAVYDQVGSWIIRGSATDRALELALADLIPPQLDGVIGGRELLRIEWALSDRGWLSDADIFWFEDHSGRRLMPGPNARVVGARQFHSDSLLVVTASGGVSRLHRERVPGGIPESARLLVAGEIDRAMGEAIAGNGIILFENLELAMADPEPRPQRPHVLLVGSEDPGVAARLYEGGNVTLNDAIASHRQVRNRRSALIESRQQLEDYLIEMPWGDLPLVIFHSGNAGIMFEDPMSISELAQQCSNAVLLTCHLFRTEGTRVGSSTALDVADLMAAIETSLDTLPELVRHDLLIQEVTRGYVQAQRARSTSRRISIGVALAGFNVLLYEVFQFAARAAGSDDNELQVTFSNRRSYDPSHRLFDHGGTDRTVISYDGRHW